LSRRHGLSRVPQVNGVASSRLVSSDGSKKRGLLLIK
jgi:hypothetical protein